MDPHFDKLLSVCKTEHVCVCVSERGIYLNGSMEKNSKRIKYSSTLSSISPQFLLPYLGKWLTL